MSYTPTEWKNGDIVTAEKLNKIETGIKNSGGVFFVESETTGGGGEPIITTLLITAQALMTAYSEYPLVVMRYIYHGDYEVNTPYIMSYFYYYDDVYCFLFSTPRGVEMEFQADTITDYPQYNSGK